MFVCVCEVVSACVCWGVWAEEHTLGLPLSHTHTLPWGLRLCSGHTHDLTVVDFMDDGDYSYDYIHTVYVCICICILITKTKRVKLILRRSYSSRFHEVLLSYGNRLQDISHSLGVNHKRCASKVQLFEKGAGLVASHSTLLCREPRNTSRKAHVDQSDAWDTMEHYP